FPRAAWLAATKAGLASLADTGLGYPDPAGLPALRGELAAYLGRVRAVSGTAANIVVTNGAAEGITLLTQVLRAAGLRRIAVENPSHPGQAELLTTHGLTPVPVTVDEQGMRVADLPRTRCRVVMITTAHQFPLGATMHPDRRRALLAWARD